MKQSTQRIPPSTLEGAARAPTMGAATITRLRSESSVNDATHVDRSAPRDDAWPWDCCAIEPSRFEHEMSDINASAWPLSYGLYQEAQRRRTAFLGDLIAAGIRGICAVVLRACARYRQSRQARATYEALHQLDDRSLRDLGFVRDEIGSVAAEVAGEAEHTRRLARLTYPAHPSLFELPFRR